MARMPRPPCGRRRRSGDRGRPRPSCSAIRATGCSTSSSASRAASCSPRRRSACSFRRSTSAHRAEVVAGFLAGTAMPAVLDVVVPHVHQRFSELGHEPDLRAPGAAARLGADDPQHPGGSRAWRAFAAGGPPGIPVALAIAIQNVPGGVQGRSARPGRGWVAAEGARDCRDWSRRATCGLSRVWRGLGRRRPAAVRPGVRRRRDAVRRRRRADTGEPRARLRARRDLRLRRRLHADDVPRQRLRLRPVVTARGSSRSGQAPGAARIVEAGAALRRALCP